MKDKCPYCKKLDCIPEVAFTNCEIYGTESFTVKCNHCKKVLEIYLSRVVEIDGIVKSNAKPSETDWWNYIKGEEYDKTKSR